MTFQTPSGFTQIDTDSGTATITNTKPNTSIVGDNGITTSASGSAITVDGTDIGIEFVQSTNVNPASPPSTIEFINLPNSAVFLFLYEKVTPSTSGAHLTLEFSNDNGSTWLTSGYSAGLNHTAFNATTFSNINSTSNFPLSDALSSSSSSLAGEIKILQMQGPDPVRVMGQTQFRNSSGVERNGYLAGVSPFPSPTPNSFRVLMNTGTMGTGRFSLYAFTRIKAF